MKEDDVTALKASCLTAVAFFGVTAITFAVVFQTMVG